MTNAEKYLKDNVSVEEFAHKIADRLVENKGLANSYANDIVYFLRREITPTLTEDERVILRNIDPMYNYIYRTYGSLRVGIKVGKMEETEIFAMYDRLFQFIKERRRI